MEQSPLVVIPMAFSLVFPLVFADRDAHRQHCPFDRMVRGLGVLTSHSFPPPRRLLDSDPIAEAELFTRN